MAFSLYREGVLLIVDVTRVKDVGKLHILSREEMHSILMEKKTQIILEFWIALASKHPSVFPAGCILPWKGKNGGDHLPADQTYWFPSGQNGPTHKEKKGQGNILEHFIVKP